jgi:hypothetical protein
MSIVYPLIITTPSGVNVGTSTFTYNSPAALSNGQELYLVLENPGALPTPLVQQTKYYVISASSTTFQLSATSGGSAISLSDGGNGNFSAYPSSDANQPSSGNYPTPQAIPPLAQAARAGRYPARKFNKREDKVIQSVTSYVPGSVVSGASSGYVTQPTTVQGALDQLAVQSSGGVAKTLAVTYNFSVNGGAIGAIALGQQLPAAAIVTEVITDVQTALVGSGTLQLTGATDGALAPTLSSASSGQIWESPTTASTDLLKKATATQNLQATIAGAVLTAGKVTWFIRYVQSA